MRMVKRTAVLDFYELVLALVLFASPWLFAFADGVARADDWLSALAVAMSSLAALIIFRDWPGWTTFILGIWIAVSPWVLGFKDAAGKGVNVAIGGLIAYIAILEWWMLHYGPVTELRES